MFAKVFCGNKNFQNVSVKGRGLFLAVIAGIEALSPAVIARNEAIQVY
jgi:hypothetical protein